MYLIESIREAFPASQFGLPVEVADLAAAEQALGHALPPVIRNLYLAFDGFVGPTNAQFFYPLARRPNVMKESLVSYTLFLRSESYFPGWLHRAVAVGDGGTGASWFALVDEPEQIVRWDAEWGDEYESCSGTLLDAWLKEKAIYASFSSDA